MPTYLFETDSGEEREAFFPVSDAPKIGDQVQIDGEMCTRVASFLLDGSGISRKTHQYPYVSHSLPPGLKGVKYVQDGRRQKPLIQSRRQEERLLARYSDKLKRDEGELADS